MKKNTPLIANLSLKKYNIKKRKGAQNLKKVNYADSPL